MRFLVVEAGNRETELAQRKTWWKNGTGGANGFPKDPRPADITHCRGGPRFQDNTAAPRVDHASRNRV
jgi:hypothetical protein